MAVPTLTSLDPSSGHPSGKYLLKITGTNFDVPVLPSATGEVEEADPTIEVTIDGRDATDIRVYSSTFMTCLVPAFRGAPSDLSRSPGYSADLVISNIGPPIESATFADAFSYKRTDLTRSEGVLRNVIRQLILDMRRQIIENVQISRQVDYDANPGDALDIVEWSTLPGIALYGPDITENVIRRFYSQENVSDLSTLEYTRYHPGRYVTLSFTADILAENFNEYLALISEFMRFFVINPTISVLSDDQDEDSDEVEFQMFLTKEPSRSGRANEASTFTGSATFQVEGVRIDADQRIPVRWGRIMDEPDDDLYLQAEEYDE